jgi:UDPglucose 6-dehydrogenase
VDLKHVLAVARDIGRHMNEYKIIAIKSTVPVGTNGKVAKEIRKYSNHHFAVVSNPEFLKEGAAIDDFLRPDRIVIGTDDEKVAEIMKKLYRPFVRSGNSIIIMDTKSAELTKYVANALLATKISFMNDVANLCDILGADVELVRQGIGSDSRTGPRFIFPGTGYGGSCFPKDVKAIIQTAEAHQYNLEIVKAVEKVNKKQKTILMKKIELYFENGLRGKTFAMWGLSFKPKTDDIREAPSIEMINLLITRGAKIKAHDPEAISQGKKIFKNLVNKNLTFFENRYEALQGADALIIMTEWNVFREPDFDLMKRALNKPVIFDGRNIYDPKTLKEFGFNYFAIGRPTF